MVRTEGACDSDATGHDCAHLGSPRCPALGTSAPHSRSHPSSAPHWHRTVRTAPLSAPHLRPHLRPHPRAHLRPHSWVLFCLDVRSPDVRLSRLRLLRLSRRGQRRPVLPLRTTQSRLVGVRAGHPAPRPGHGVRPVRHRHLRRRLRADAARVGRTDRRERAVQFPFARRLQHLAVRRKRRDPGFRSRPVVDGPLGVLAAWLAAAHPVQRALDPSARAGSRRAVRARPHGDHLHRGRRHRISRELDRWRLSRLHAADPERRAAHGWRLGGDLRSSRRAGLLRAAHGVPRRALAGALLGGDAVRVRPRDERRGQLRARRRIRRRLARRPCARPLEAGAGQSPRGRARRASPCRCSPSSCHSSSPWDHRSASEDSASCANRSC